MPKRQEKTTGEREFQELLERAAEIKRTSTDLIRQMHELASQIAEARAREADKKSKRDRDGA